MSIKGLVKLSKEQQEHIMRVNKHHTDCNGTDRKPGMKIVEAWVNENGVTCVRLLNGEWYHYYKNGTWA